MEPGTDQVHHKFTTHSLRSFKTPSTQRILSLSFTVDPVKRHGTGTPVNENHPKLRFIWFVSQNASISIKSIIRWVPDTLGLVITLLGGLRFISFRPPLPCGMLALWNSAMRTSYGGFHRAGLFLWGRWWNHRTGVRDNKQCV
jgi:hypothetical protein